MKLWADQGKQSKTNIYESPPSAVGDRLGTPDVIILNKKIHLAIENVAAIPLVNSPMGRYLFDFDRLRLSLDFSAWFSEAGLAVGP